MDNPKKHAAAAGNKVAGASNKRFKHFHEGPNAIAQDEEEKQSSVAAAPARASPIGRLYADALGVIFDFLWIDECSRALAVSRGWSAFVRSSMPWARFHVSCSAESLVPISSSALARHIIGIKHVGGARCRLTSDSLSTLARVMPHILSVECIIGSAAIKMILPAKLKKLELDLSGLDADGINRVVEAIGRLTALLDLTLILSSWPRELCFAPLSQCAALRELTVKEPSWLQWKAQPSDAHINQLRALHHLRSVNIPRLNGASLTKLLRAPHSLEWTELSALSFVDSVGAASLRNLPGLLIVDALFCSSVDFLSALSRLHSLTLRAKSRPWAVTADTLVEAVSSCPQLTYLDLTAPVSSKHLGALLPQLPLLRTLVLTLCTELESLSFLSSVPSLQRMLESLELDQCTHPDLRSDEFRHILALKELSVLRLLQSGSEPLDRLSQQMLTPPTIMLPKLHSFRWRPPAAIFP